MITNFEAITSELSEEEEQLLPILIKGFLFRKKENPIKGPEIVTALKAKGYKITEPRLRKLCNYIRSHSLIPLIATSNGYYVSYDKEEIKLQIRSLTDRAEAIVNSALGLQYFIDNESERKNK
jgi:hypothetical protein